MNHQMVGQTSDRKQGCADKALADTELIGAVGRDNRNTPMANLHYIDAAVFSGDGEGVAFCHIV